MSIINVNSYVDNRFVELNTNNLQNDFNPLNLQKNFLNLLITQIKNQDPTDPIKNTELTSQLAQINTATGIERLNNNIANISNQINKMQNFQVSSLIGRRVMVPNTQIIHKKDNNTRFGIELIKYATSVEIEIKDKQGHIIYTKKMNNMTPGIYNFIWDGRDSNKKSVNSAKYNILVTAKNNEQNVPVQSLSEALVHSFVTSSGDPIIDLGEAGNTTLSQIREILQ